MNLNQVNEQPQRFISHWCYNFEFFEIVEMILHHHYELLRNEAFCDFLNSYLSFTLYHLELSVIVFSDNVVQTFDTFQSYPDRINRTLPHFPVVVDQCIIHQYLHYQAQHR